MSFDLTYVFIIASLLIAAFIKGATGLGFPLIATPALALLLDIRTAVTVLILPNLFMDSAQVIRDGLPYDIFRRFSGVILPTITISTQGEKVLSPIVGFISGVLNGMTNAAGPALAIYLYSLRLDKRVFVKSIATIFITTKLSQLVAISTWNLFNWDTIKLSIQVLLLSLAGFYAGIKAHDSVNQINFNRGLLLLLSLIGGILIVRALT
jgi:uncharacterized membrane protein YfcA